MLTNSQRLKIIAEAKRSGYKGSYLDLLKQYEQGGFSNDINKPAKSTYVDKRSGYGFPTTYSHGGPHMPTVNIPEVEISALTDKTYDKLSQAQKKLYDLYQTPEGTRQAIPITVGRDRKVTQDIHYLDALNLAARNPLTQIINEPSFVAKNLMDIDKDQYGQFRAHYVPHTGNIHITDRDAYAKKMSALNRYVVIDRDFDDSKEKVTDMNLGNPEDLRKLRSSGNLHAYNPDFSSQREFLESDPARKAQMIENAKRGPTPEQLDKAASKSLEMAFEEYAHADGDTFHPMQNFIGQGVTQVDRLRRLIKEGSYPDASNYSSKYDLEYHTHNSPNSAVNQLADRYGMDQYDMVTRKPTIGQYNFPMYNQGTVGGDPRRFRTDYDPGVTRFKRAGGFANLPDPDPKPTMSQSLQRFMKQEHMPPMKNFEEGGMKDSSPQQYQVEVIKYPLGYKNMPPGHIESRILNVDDLPEEYGNVTKELNPWPEGNRRVYYSPERSYAPGVETTILNLNKKDLETYLDAAQKGDYNFLTNNCADQTCAAFGLDQSKYTALGVTTPQQVFDALKNDPRAVKGSTTGDATIVEDSLKLVNEGIKSTPQARALGTIFDLAEKSAKAFKRGAAKYDKTMAESKASARNRTKAFEDGGLSTKSDSTIIQKNDPLVDQLQTAARPIDQLKFDNKGVAYDLKTGEKFSGDIIFGDSAANKIPNKGRVSLHHSPYGRSTSGKTDKHDMYYHVENDKVYTRSEYKKLLNSYKVLYNKTRKETE